MISTFRTIGALLAFVLFSQGCIVERVEDLAERFTPDREADQPLIVCEERATTRLALSANLSSAAAPAPTWDPARPVESSSFSIHGVLYGEQDRAVNVGIFFAAEGAGRWRYYALPVADDTFQGELGRGQLSFDAEGALQSHDVVSPLRLPRPNGTLGAAVELWMGTAKSRAADGLDGVISTPEPSSTHRFEHDGHPKYESGACPTDAP